MDIKEFVKNVLVSIDKAVEEARGETQRDITFSNTKDQRTVEFDIAVSVEEIDVKSGRAGIRVLPFVEGGGDISKENKNSTVSRIKFGVQIASMTKDEEKRERARFDAYHESNKRLNSAR